MTGLELILAVLGGIVGGFILVALARREARKDGREVRENYGGFTGGCLGVLFEILGVLLLAGGIFMGVMFLLALLGGAGLLGFLK